MKVAFRCDGDGRIGAGHVARSVQIAAAFRRAGHEPRLVGRFEGLAADLVAAAGIDVSPPGPGAAGVAGRPDAAVVDSYEIDASELRSLAAAVPTAALWDHGAPPPASLLVHYHAGAAPEGAGQTEMLLGPAFAPVAPRFVAARRPRGLERALVTVGGSDTGRELVAPSVRGLEGLGEVEVVVAGSGAQREVGLADRARWADVAVTAAGATAYELACAGVPTVAVAITANQQPVVEGLAGVGAVRALDALSGGLDGRLQEEIAALGNPAERERLAAHGPAVVDGGGAARIRDGLLAVAGGGSPPQVLGFRPAVAEDASRLFAWRSDPVVRAASRSTAPVQWEDHVTWLERTLGEPSRTLWMVERDGEDAGSVRFDHGDGSAEISISLGDGHRGGGVGTRAIREATELYLAAHPAVATVEAHVRPDNPGSVSAFERAGYGGAELRDGMTVLEARQAGAA